MKAIREGDLIATQEGTQKLKIEAADAELVKILDEGSPCLQKPPCIQGS